MYIGEMYYNCEPEGSISFNSAPLDKMATILADNVFKCILYNWKFWILNKVSLKFVPKGPIDNNPALV